MIYLDYSATTPVNEEVIETYAKVCKEYIGNPNSLHKLGVKAKQLIDASSEQIAKILGIKPSEIIYTSGASEANNLAIKGVCEKYSNRGKHIITTELEHSSIIAPLNYLQNNGWDVDFVKLDSNGQVDLDDLDRLMRDETVLVTIASVNSEVGVKQDLKAIRKNVRKNSKTIFHSDVTQSIGKEKIDFSLVDLASISCQKFYGMKGIGALIKRDNLIIEPLIHGGKSTTVFRSGTPATPLIASFAKALRLMYEDFDEKLSKVKEIHDYLLDKLVDVSRASYPQIKLLLALSQNISAQAPAIATPPAPAKPAVVATPNIAPKPTPSATPTTPVNGTPESKPEPEPNADFTPSCIRLKATSLWSSIETSTSKSHTSDNKCFNSPFINGNTVLITILEMPFLPIISR